MHVSVKVIFDLKNRSEKAFDKVCNAYHRYIYYIVLTFVYDKEAAKDITQDAFIKMYKDIHTLNNPEAFHLWFITISKNLAKDYLKKKANQHLSLDEALLETIEDYTYSPSPGVLRFDNLSDDELKLINYKIVFNRSFKEISVLMDLSFDVVTKMYYKALKKLKKELEVL